MQENHGSIVRLLLARPDIRVNMRGMDGHTALIRACFERCVAACSVTRLTECCRADLVRLLLQRPDTDVNLATYYGTTALTFAIRSGNVAAVGAAANAIYDLYRALHTRCGSCWPTPAST